MSFILQPRQKNEKGTIKIASFFVYLFIYLFFKFSYYVSLFVWLWFSRWVVASYEYIIIIMSRYQHRYPWPSLTTPPYSLSLRAGLQGYIPYRQRAAVCRFELVVLPLLVHVKWSTGVHPYFPSSVLRAWFV